MELPEELVRETDGFWKDPQNILNLIDLLGLYEDPEKEKVYS